MAICFSKLQQVLFGFQNGEFVDMTLAADGHFVKVHQVIVALASPYLKELMTSAECPHPVIFLNVCNILPNRNFIICCMCYVTSNYLKYVLNDLCDPSMMYMCMCCCLRVSYTYQTSLNNITNITEI